MLQNSPFDTPKIVKIKFQDTQVEVNTNPGICLTFHDLDSWVRQRFGIASAAKLSYRTISSSSSGKVAQTGNFNSQLFRNC